MAKRKNDKGSKSVDQQREELKKLYAEYRRKFSAADLQKYTRIEKGIPLEKVIADMEEIQRSYKPRKT